MLSFFIYNNIFFHLDTDPNDASGQGCIREIVYGNEYELNTFVNQKDKIFIDIGANLGVATLIMAKLNPESIIYSFEPHKKTFDLLVRNIAVNNLTNVKAFNLAVSNKINCGKQLKLTTLYQMSGANSLCAELELFNKKYEWGLCREEIVNCISFDEILISNNIKEVFLLKIDCEGAEYDIIYDSQLFTDGIVKNIIGEFHEVKYLTDIKNKKSNELIKYCENYIEGIIKISVLTE